MHRNDSLCLLCNRRLDQLFIHIHGIRTDVHKDRRRAPEHKGVRCGHEGIGRHNDLIAGLNVKEQGRHLGGMGTGGGQKSLRRPSFLLDPCAAFLRKHTIAADMLR